jgi:2-methylcitrate dehydratase
MIIGRNVFEKFHGRTPMDRRHFLAGTGALTMADAIGLGAAVAQNAAGETRAPAPHISIERELAQYGAGLTYEKLPRAVVDAAKRLLIDALACGYGAIGSPSARIVEATFRKSFGGPPVASVLGSAALTSAEGAALINGVLIRDLDLNDTHVGKEPCHPSENIPAALACCEEAARSGRDLIETIVLGYEAQLAFNSAFAFGERGFFSVSSAGFVVPLMAGKAWRLPVEQVVEAIGISGVRQLTLLAITRGPISMMKALPYAHNAMDGLFATRLAAAGFTGPGNAMDWFLSEVKPAEPAVRLDLAAGKFRIGQVGLKRFPLQFELQTVAEAGVNLHAKARERVGAIAAIVVETYPITIERTASPSRYDPKTRETADHSLPVCLAMALIDGEVTIAQYEKERWRAPDVLGLARKIAVKVGERLTQSGRGSGAIVKLEFADGTSLEEIVPIADGDARRPMSRPALEQKFKSLAVPTLGEAGAAHVLALVDNLETLPDLKNFTAALRGA